MSLLAGRLPTQAQAQVQVQAADEDSPTSSSENESLSDSSSENSSSSCSSRSGRRRLVTSTTSTINNGKEPESASSSGSDSYSSSSSWSSSSSEGHHRAKTHVPELSRKVLRIRRALYEALRCALILAAQLASQGSRSGSGSDRCGESGRGISSSTKGKSRKKGRTKAHIQTQTQTPTPFKEGKSSRSSTSASATEMGEDIVDRPWSGLLASLKILQPAVPSSVSKGQDGSARVAYISCIRVLNVLLRLSGAWATDKDCRRTLHGAEAKAARSLSASPTSMSLAAETFLSSVDEDEDEEEARYLLDATPPLILLRLARFALAQPPPLAPASRPRPNTNSRNAKRRSTRRLSRYLDLSNLPYINPGPGDVLRTLEFTSLFHLFGIDRDSVTHLDLSNNQLRDLPLSQATLDFPFPNLRTLNLTSNPLSTLPLSLLRTAPSLRQIIHRRTHLHPSSRDDEIVRPPNHVHLASPSPSTVAHNPTSRTEMRRKAMRLPSLGPALLKYATLVDFALVAILRTRQFDADADADAGGSEFLGLLGLAPHLVEKIGAAWTCDLCNEVQLRRPCPLGLLRKSGQRSEGDASQSKVRVGWLLNPCRPYSHSSAVLFSGRVCEPCRAEYALTYATVK